MPNNVFSSDMEESLISCVLQHGESFDILKDNCDYKDFWFQPYSSIWYACKKLQERSSEIDLITVSDEMQRNGTLEKLTTFDGKYSADSALKFIKEKEGVVLENAETYALQVREDSSKRKIQELTNRANDWINQGHSALDILTNLDIESGKISAYSNTNVKSMMTISAAVDAAMEQTEYASKNHIKYIETGIKSLDEKLGGLFPGYLVIIAARAGMGKTALAASIASNVSMINTFPKKVGIFTLEMDTTEYTDRMISSLCGIPYIRIKKGNIYDSERDSYKEATRKIKDANNIIIDDTVGITTSMIRSKLRKMKEWGIELAIIDQLGLVSDRIANEPEYLRIDRITYQFKNMAREFGIPIIVLHQMNRSIESAQRTSKKEPQMSDLDQASEKASDVILMISHVTQQKIIQSSKIWVVKNRFGGTGCADVKFEASKTLFRDLTKEEMDELEPELVK